MSTCRTRIAAWKADVFGRATARVADMSASLVVDDHLYLDVCITPFLIGRHPTQRRFRVGEHT